VFRKGEWIIHVLNIRGKIISDCHHKAPLDEILLCLTQPKDVAEDRELLAVRSAGAVNTPEARITDMMTEGVERLTCVTNSGAFKQTGVETHM